MHEAVLKLETVGEFNKQSDVSQVCPVCNQSIASTLRSTAQGNLLHHCRMIVDFQCMSCGKTWTSVPNCWHHAVRRCCRPARNGAGKADNQLKFPWGLYVTEEETVYVADSLNHRVMKWPRGQQKGLLAAGAPFIFRSCVGIARNK